MNVERNMVCGVDCHRGDANCNGYCEGKADHPPSYRLELLNFGDALFLLKAGQKVARLGWNGKGMFVYLVPGNSYEPTTEAAKSFFRGELVPYNPYFAIKNVNNTVSTWVPSVNDCLAEDWVVVQ